MHNDIFFLNRHQYAGCRTSLISIKPMTTDFTALQWFRVKHHRTWRTKNSIRHQLDERWITIVSFLNTNTQWWQASLHFSNLVSNVDHHQTDEQTSSDLQQTSAMISLLEL